MGNLTKIRQLLSSGVESRPEWNQNQCSLHDATVLGEEKSMASTGMESKERKLEEIGKWQH